MSDRDGGSGNSGGRGTEDEAALSARLKRLGEELREQRNVAPEKPGPAAGLGSGLTDAFRLAAGFVAGVLVGAGLGWLFDLWLGTSPFGLIVFLLLGFAAGVLNVLREAGRVKPPSIGGPAERVEDDPDD
ncbi:MAG: AtpZ/AtpI family protein [Bauldia sp.]|nr:AtpZ/AtpI family protein [Bauldia sp.]